MSVPLQGKIPHTELENFLFENGFDPANLAEFTVDQVEDGLSKFQWLREGGHSFIDNANQLKLIADRIEAADKAQGENRSRKNIANDYGLEFSSLRHNMLRKCWSEFKDDFRKQKITFSTFSSSCESSELGSLPSIDIIVQILSKYCEQLVTKNRNKLLPSDLGDITHAIYLPYVDIFRADKNMTHLYKPIGELYKTKVCRTLKELIGELERISRN